MYIIILIVIAIVFLISPVFRCLLLNVHKYIVDRLRDIYIYIRYKKYNEAKQLNQIIFVSHPSVAYGSGKTLMTVKFFYNYYKRYNNKVVYIKDDKGNYVKKIQKLVAFSNLSINGIPTIPFDSLEMIEEWKDKKEELEKNDSNSIYKLIILTDELGCVLNSRSFKSNITNSNINAILQQRHLGVTLWVSSSQRFSYVDALYRNSIDKALTCRLIGFLDFKKRLLLTEMYLGQDLENATGAIQPKPLKRKCYFIIDKDYTRYDTTHMIEDLIHKSKTGDLISDEEYLKSIQNDNINITVKNVTKKKKGLFR